MPQRRLGRSFDPIAHIERPVRRFFRAAEAPLPVSMRHGVRLPRKATRPGQCSVCGTSVELHNTALREAQAGRTESESKAQLSEG
ncbi:hypothetical protein HBI23_013550 [Parastagonospora nodorum]|nr:hypothetical protein HBH71_004680 [Parastagonospora nodorum]KAH5371581.1 hypothetical protein HBI48_036140 [Parastagonospora nodorum]KAH5478135.1 hypothetical protein HBI28_063600 [Parastagonospora nodorum]KAH5529541.1 hypothetical protein HBI29_017510 [Parastagonospora nodorum]KAH5635500.1 hypothetical protein HBI22_092800 [Parastagonospora nodorum]